MHHLMLKTCVGLHYFMVSIWFNFMKHFLKRVGVYSFQQDAPFHGRTHYRGNIILASGNQKYPMSQTTWTTSPHRAYFTMSWETLTMCWETWCSFDLNTIKFNGLYKHRSEVIKLWFSKTWWRVSQDMVKYALCGEVVHVVWDIGYLWLPDARMMFPR